MAEPFYITTAISYPNGRPHIGHAYEAIAADAIARFQRQSGRDVRFQTGTDEHGLKMLQTARLVGKDVEVFAKEMSGQFRTMCDRLDISYDRFIRTTERSHHGASQAIWNAMAERGDLYASQYKGWYSVRDEAFYDEDELVIEAGGAKLSPQGTPVEWTEEESWFFRLSRYQQPLLDHFATHPEFLRPQSRRNEVVRFVENGLSDLSVSRSSFDWGVQVPGEAGHVMYVWVDALTNYLSGLGYPELTPEWKFWPANLHLVGKDIVRFHAVYWPAMLMSAGLTLPHCIFGHGFLLSRGEKMSKSEGNTVDPISLVDMFGKDALRYFLLREVSFGHDGSYSSDAIISRVNADLANSFGNLAQRTLAFIAKNLDGVLPAEGRVEAVDVELLTEVETACSSFCKQFDDLALNQALETWIQAVFSCNQYIDAQAPWALRKTDPDRMHAVLGTLIHAIRMLAILIIPVIPDSANRLLDQIGVKKRDHAALADPECYSKFRSSKFRIVAPTPIFPRLDSATKLV